MTGPGSATGPGIAGEVAEGGCWGAMLQAIVEREKQIGDVVL